MARSDGRKVERWWVEETRPSGISQLATGGSMVPEGDVGSV